MFGRSTLAVAVTASLFGLAAPAGATTTSLRHL